MKIELHVPVEQYGFVGATIEIDGPESYSLIPGFYDGIKAAFAEKPANTLDDKAMTEFLFAQIHGLGNHIETYEMMNPAQQHSVKLLKNALARKKPLLTNMENKQTI